LNFHALGGRGRAVLVATTGTPALPDAFGASAGDPGAAPRNSRLTSPTAIAADPACPADK